MSAKGWVQACEKVPAKPEGKRQGSPRFTTEDPGVPEAGGSESPVGKKDEQDSSHAFPGATAPHAKSVAYSGTVYSCDFADTPRFQLHPCPPLPCSGSCLVPGTGLALGEAFLLWPAGA